MFLTCAGEATLSMRGNGNRTESEGTARLRKARQQGVSDDSIAILVSGAVSGSTAIMPVPRSTHLLALVLASLIAGYVGAGIAGRDHVLHGASIAWPPLLLMSVFFFAAPALFEWTPIVDTALAALSGAVGGWHRHRQHLARPAPG